MQRLAAWQGLLPKGIAVTLESAWRDRRFGVAALPPDGWNLCSSEFLPISRRFRTSIVLALLVFDACGAAAAGQTLQPQVITLQSAMVSASLLMLTSWAAGFYGVDTWINIKRSILGALALFGLVLPIATTGTWLFYDGRQSSRVATALACSAGGVVFGRLLLVLASGFLAERFTERVLIIGTRNACETLVRAQCTPEQGTDIVSQVLLGDATPHMHWVEGLNARFVDRGGSGSCGITGRSVDRILILKAGIDDDRLADIVTSLDAWSSPVFVVTKSLATRSPDSAGWLVRGEQLNASTALVKRAIDISASAITLVMLAAPMVFIALLIRLETPGPALFRQTRTGRDNRPFTVLKFRTMRADNPGADGSIQAVRGDRRVTRVGASLRKASIDELPQLLNVLSGSMSLVGPRPHPTVLDRQFASSIEGYSARYRMAPGITGWAQVKGFRGETQTVEQMRSRVELDLEYVRTHSIALDLWILLRTAVSLIAHRNVVY